MSLLLLRSLSRIRSAGSRLLATCTTAQAESKPAVFVLDNATIFPFGVPSNEPSQALFRDTNWVIGDKDCWAILSPSSSPSKAHLLSTILAHTRFHPPSSGSHPILESIPLVTRDPQEGPPRLPIVSDIIQLVSFKTRLQGGAFEDYTARYYSIRDQDKLTLRQHLQKSTAEPEADVIFETAKLLEMEDFLELPIVTLSNGQTRRARICKALLAKPELLILEEPYTGLDVASRMVLSTVLEQLQSAQAPRVFLVLRPQDPLPSFVSHVALIAQNNTVQFGSRDKILELPSAKELLAAGARERESAEEKKQARKEKSVTAVGGKPLVELRNVNVSYGPRDVLVDINWTVREGERWVLSGHNGSGKSTLLSLILGDHPRSFMEDISLFGLQRIKQATATIQMNTGHVSPEIFNAFPRKSGPAALTVQDAIVTGFASIYCYRHITPDQQVQLDRLLKSFDLPLLTPQYLTREFASLPPGEQSLVLFLRALVKDPALLILDECFMGMNKELVDKVKYYLDHGLRKEQAVVLISHFEEELPDSVTKSIMLEHGRIVELV